MTKEQFINYMYNYHSVSRQEEIMIYDMIIRTYNADNRNS